MTGPALDVYIAGPGRWWLAPSGPRTPRPKHAAERTRSARTRAGARRNRRHHAVRTLKSDKAPAGWPPRGWIDLGWTTDGNAFTPEPVMTASQLDGVRSILTTGRTLTLGLR